MRMPNCADSAYFDDLKIQAFDIPKTRTFFFRKTKQSQIPRAKRFGIEKGKRPEQPTTCNEQYNPSFGAGLHEEKGDRSEQLSYMRYAARLIAGLMALLAYVSLMLPRAVFAALVAGLLETASMLALPATVGLACGFFAVQRLMKQPSLPERMMSAYANPHKRTSGSSETP